MENEGFYIPKRYILTTLGFIGVFNIYSMRTSLGIAIVAMVNNTENSYSNRTVFSTECPDLISQAKDIEVNKFIGTRYNWSTQQQSLILGVFYIGYIITQLPGGYLSEKFGAKWIFGGGVLNTAIFTLLTPFIVRWNVNAFIIARVIEGFGEGLTIPAINLMLSQWSPMTERSRITTIVYSGLPLGNVFSMLVTGWLSSSNLLGGWPSAFYLFGLVGPGVCLLVVTVSGCRPYLIVLLISIGMGLNGCAFSGFNVTHMDMSRTFAGTMYGLTNAVGVLSGFIGPAMVGAFTKSGATFENWNYVFYIMAGIYIVAAAFFAAFASAEPQPWGTGQKELTHVTKF